MTVEIVVRDPVPINRFYARGKGRRFYTTSEGKAFKVRAMAAAMAARCNSSWPADPYRVGKARLSYQLFDYRGDTDGPRKVLRDCFERLLYVNDRCVEDGPAPFAISDGNGRRVVVTVELLELRTVEEAVSLRADQAKRDEARLRAKARRALKKHGAA